jgi:putative oxidoreductase
LNPRVLDGAMRWQASRELNAMPAGGHTVIRLPRAAVWACAIFLALAFILVGMSKLEGASATRWTERLAQWGYPANAQYLIGLFEIIGGLGVLIPRWRRAAAAILVALMIGALCTHAVQGEFSRLIPPLVLGGLALLLYSSRLRPGGEQTRHRGTGV